MSDPQRLLFDKDATAAEKELLESWKREQPSAGAREKTLAMLGLGGASIGAAAAGSSIAPKAIASWTMLAVTKWLVIGSLLAGLTVTGVLSLRASARPVETATPAPLAPPAPTPTTAPTTAPPTAVVEPWVPVPRAAPAPVAPQAPEAPAPAVVKPSPAPRADAHPIEGGTLARQIALLDRARAALAAGDAAHAQELVNDYEARFPEGSFVEEAEVLRVEALVRAGDRAGATRVGTRFLNAHPTSAHAPRVRALLGSAAP